MSDSDLELEHLATIVALLIQHDWDTRQRMLRYLQSRQEPVEPPHQRARRILEAAATIPPAVRFRGMVESGLIDDEGRYIGHDKKGGAK